MKIRYNYFIRDLFLKNELKYKIDTWYLILKKSGLDWKHTAVSEWIIITSIALGYKAIADYSERKFLRYCRSYRAPLSNQYSC